MTKHPPFAWLRRGKRMTDDEERSPHADADARNRNRNRVRDERWEIRGEKLKH